MQYITYLVYIIIFKIFVLGGTGYAVFVLGHSGWWFIPAFILSGAAYTPGSWFSKGEPR